MTNDASDTPVAGSTLSVVIPAHDEAAHLPATLAALAGALAVSPFEADVVLVDDGSSDGTASVAEEALADRLPLSVVRQPNAGRFAARAAGVAAARGAWLLFLDARVRLRRDSLAFVHDRLRCGDVVWNGHVHVDADGNPYGAFWNTLVELAWRDYFADARTTSFDAKDFDRYPKGTTCFLAPRSLAAQAFAAARSRYADTRHANDDTPLLRWIAGRERIHLSPSFACDYSPRASLPTFVRHAFHRGVVFFDGHARRESRFFPLAAAFYPASGAVVAASLRRPVFVPALAAAGISAVAAAVAAAARRPAFEVMSFAALSPVYTIAHGIGMWRGLGIAVRDTAVRSPRR